MTPPPPEAPIENRVVREFKVLNAHGLHARSGALLVKTANRFPCDIKISKDGTSVNAKSIMGVLILAAGTGSLLTVTAEGEKALEAVTALGELFAAAFYEKP
jgi:phosphocarrier protein HPr